MTIFFNPTSINYRSLQPIINKSFICGYCGDKVSSDRGYKIGQHSDASGKQLGGIYICPNCQGPTFFPPPPQNGQFPGEAYGNSVKNVPSDLNTLYEESRNCYSKNAFTAVVLLCRKMLMNIAVEQGANEGLRFIQYVEYLENNNYIPPNSKDWVDHIRKKGNEANHEINLMNKNNATELLIFVEMLLKFLYEFPNMVSPTTN